MNADRIEAVAAVVMESGAWRHTAETMAKARRIAQAVLAMDAAPATFKRHGDPHGCPERTALDCLGVRMHCRLEPHRPLGHEWKGNEEACQFVYAGSDGESLGPCNDPRGVHDTPHAMEVSGPYVLEHDR